MNGNIICNYCGFINEYDTVNIWYLKCHRCDNVLVDVDLEMVCLNLGKKCFENFQKSR